MAIVEHQRSTNILLADETPLDRRPAAVYLASLSPGSRRSMRQALDTIAALLTRDADALTLAWWELRYQHVAAIRASLAEAYAPSTANKMLAALRGVLRECWRLDLIPEADFRKAIDVPGVRGQALPAGRALAIGEIRGLFEACSSDHSIAGVRDAAIIAVLYACGLRRAEVSGLDVEDVQPEGLRVKRGKGRKERMVPLAVGAVAAIKNWIKARGDAQGPLFMPIDKAGWPTIRRLSGQAVYNVVRKRATEAGVAHFTPHDMRRSLISHLLEAGADLVTVSRIAGHASVTTTAKYDRRGDEAKQKAIELLNVPYRG